MEWFMNYLQNSTFLGFSFFFLGYHGIFTSLCALFRYGMYCMQNQSYTLNISFLYSNLFFYCSNTTVNIIYI